MDDDSIVMGVREQWGQRLPFSISNADRRYHLYAIGKSGSGKTTMLRNMILQDIYQGHGVGVIDPHGDLATELLEFIPSNRIEDVVYFNPSRLSHPVGLNVLAYIPPDHRYLVVSGVVSAFKNIWADSWGPRLEYILSASVAALLDCQGVSLLGLPPGNLLLKKVRR